MKAIIFGWKDGKPGIGSDNPDFHKELDNVPGVTSAAYGDGPRELGVKSSFQDAGGRYSYVLNNTNITAHGIYEYNGNRYVVISSDKQFQYRNFDEWVPFFDTDNGHYLSDELQPDAAGQYWYLVPQEHYCSDLDKDQEPLKFIGSDDKALEKQAKDLNLDQKVLLHITDDKITAKEVVGLVKERDNEEIWITVKDDGSAGLSRENASRKTHSIYPSDLKSDNTGIIEYQLVEDAVLVDKNTYENYKPYFDAVGKYIQNDVTFETKGKKIVSILIDEKLEKENVWFLVEDNNTRPGRYHNDNTIETYPKVTENQRLKEVPAWQAAFGDSPPEEDTSADAEPQGENDVADEEETELEELEEETQFEPEESPIKKEKKRFTNMFEDIDVKGAAKNSATTLADRAKHGMAVGAATEGANYAYEIVAEKLQSQFGVSKETLEDPMKRELVMAVAVALLHMGSEVFDEQIPGMDKVRSGCELVVEGKMKDNFGTLLRTAVPLLVQAKDLMDPKQAMSRLVITNTDKFRVAEEAPAPPVPEKKELEEEQELEEEILLEETIPARMG